MEIEKELFSYFLNLTILNSHILLQSHGSKISYRDFRLTFLRNMVELGGPQTSPLQPISRQSTWVTRIGHLQESSCQHWSTKTGKRTDCVVTPKPRRDAKFNVQKV
jgi:hypothetical protein